MKKSDFFYLAGVVFVVLAIVLAVVAANAYKVIDPKFLLKNLEYPTIYPMEKATYTANFLIGFLVFSVGSALGCIIAGIGAIISSMPSK